jgi:hypothetical protein
MAKEHDLFVFIRQFRHPLEYLTEWLEVRAVYMGNSKLTRLANINQAELVSSLSPGVYFLNSKGTEIRHSLSSILSRVRWPLCLDQRSQSLDVCASLGKCAFAGHIGLPEPAFGDWFQASLTDLARQSCDQQAGYLRVLYVERNGSVGKLSGRRVCSFRIIR